MKITLNNQLFINLLFCIFPISFILGNQATNVVTIVLIFYVLIAYNKQILKMDFFLLDKILLLFFAYIFFTFLINYFESIIKGEKFSEIIIFKSFYFYKYLFLYLILRFLLFKKIIKNKYSGGIKTEGKTLSSEVAKPVNTSEPL